MYGDIAWSVAHLLLRAFGGERRIPHLRTCATITIISHEALVSNCKIKKKKKTHCAKVMTDE